MATLRKFTSSWVDLLLLVCVVGVGALHSLGFLIIKLNSNCRGDGCLGLGLPALLAFVANASLGFIAFVVLLGRFISGYRVECRQIAMLGVLGLIFFALLYLYTH